MKKRIPSRTRTLAVWISSIALIFGSSSFVGYETIANPRDYKGSGNGVEQLVQIKNGDTLSSLAPELVARGIVATNSAFLQAANSNPAANNITPGVYRLQEHMSARDAVAALIDPQNRLQELIVTGGQTLLDTHVVGGTTRLGIFSSIAQVTNNQITEAELEEAAGNASIQDLGVPEWAETAVLARGTDPRRLEGLIIPGSYIIHPEQNATEILHSLITESIAQLSEEEQRYAILVEASLVEKESSAQDFGKVARVILNRLAANMRLELDSTVNYDLADQEIATTNEDRARVTAWNTYAMEGLPATPIGAPSLESIEAVTHPEDGPWLFFVTIDSSGTTIFSTTFEEHQAAVNQALANGILDSQR